VPQLQGLFHFATLHPTDWLICTAAGLVSILWFEALKFWSARRRPRFTAENAENGGIR
jgi:hypothetical protein